MEFLLTSSPILKNDINKINCIINWINEKTNQNSIETELIFKMSENGSNGSDFHRYCDNKGPTLILIKTKNNRIFGGFTPLNWINKSASIKDESNQTFIFSLNLMKKFDSINYKNNPAIICNLNYGPNFGVTDFQLKENLKNGESYADSSCAFLSKNSLELTGGNGNKALFETEEFEVYKIIY